MATRMGYGGLGILYSYFLVSGAVVRSLSPQFPKIIAEQARGGAGRRGAKSDTGTQQRWEAEAEAVAGLCSVARQGGSEGMSKRDAQTACLLRIQQHSS